MESFTLNEIYKCKLLMIGPSSVGKTAVMKRFIRNEFSRCLIPYPGVDIKRKTVERHGITVHVEIWDTPGMDEIFLITTKSICKNLDGIIFTYDIADRISFQRIGHWLKLVQEKINTKDMKVILIGNKCDLEEIRQVQTNEGSTMAKNLGMSFDETSAKDGTNVEKVFMNLIDEVLRKKHDMAQSMQEQILKGKVLIIGDSGVGKTSVILRFMDNEFFFSFISTIGIDSKKKTIEVQGKKIELTIWDTAGQEKFNSITRSFFRGVDAVIFVYDITEAKSLKNITYWTMLLKSEVGNKDVKKMLLGNKCDLEESREVRREEGLKMAEKHGMQFNETSAKDNMNIEKAFQDIANAIVFTKTTMKPNQLLASGITQIDKKNSNQQSSTCFCT